MTLSKSLQMLLPALGCLVLFAATTRAEDPSAQQNMSESDASDGTDELRGNCVHIQFCDDPRSGGGVTCFIDDFSCATAEACLDDAEVVCGARHYDHVCDVSQCYC